MERQASPRTRGEERIIKITIIVLSLTFVLGATEIFLTFYAKINPQFKERSLKPFLYNQELPFPYCGHQSTIDYSAAKRNSPDEYIIVFSGGSTAQGVGASEGSKTIGARLEKYLNEKNIFSNISKFVVVNAANPSYHTTQEKNVFFQFIFLEYDINMFILIDGFNNLARPIENYAYQLPLNFPGWPWIVNNPVYMENPERYYLGKLLEDIRDKKIAKKSKLLFIILNQAVSLLLKPYYYNWGEAIDVKLSRLDDRTKMRILDKSAKFYKEDITEIDCIALEKNIETLFILQPLLGFLKDELTESERAVIENRLSDLSLASHELWVHGHKGLQKAGKELRQRGINFFDFSAIF